MAFEKSGMCAICQQQFETGVTGVKLWKGAMIFNKMIDSNDLYAHADCITEYNRNNYVQLRIY